jgi:hypothetical protein
MTANPRPPYGERTAKAPQRTSLRMDAYGVGGTPE